MKLSNLWKEKDVTLSFEAFPPKKDSDFDSVATAVEKIAQLKPDFMSVTYGAGGGTSTYTSQIAQIVQAQGVTALAHLTCVSSDRERIHHELDALKEAGIENILALRGDYPEGYDPAAPRDFRYAYELNTTIEQKLDAIVKNVYHGAGVTLTPAAKKQAQQLTELGFGEYPICMAKTQYSFSDDQKLLGAPEGFTVTVRNLKVSAGAGFIVALTGDIMTMTGLPKVPAAENIDVTDDGRIVGLF